MSAWARPWSYLRNRAIVELTSPSLYFAEWLIHFNSIIFSVSVLVSKRDVTHTIGTCIGPSCPKELSRKVPHQQVQQAEHQIIHGIDTDRQRIFFICSVIVVVDRFCIALFSTLKQTHCAYVACDSNQVTSFLQRTLNIHPRGVLTALFGSYMADHNYILWRERFLKLWF